MVENTKGNSFSFTCKDVVTCVEFCPFEAASELIAFGGQLRVSIGVIRFQVNNVYTCMYVSCTCTSRVSVMMFMTSIQ